MDACMEPIKLIEGYNYIAAFLTLGCQLKCSYCINIQQYERSAMAKARKAMSAKDWITALNRLEATQDLPITLQGGEPTSHRDFYEIINHVDKPMDLLTNCQFNINDFIKHVPVSKFKRNAPYASIRVSFHPEQMELDDTVARVGRLVDAGFQVGVWMVEVPEQMHIVDKAAQKFSYVARCSFKVKELLGEHKGTIHGTYKYKDSVDMPEDKWKTCYCRTSELLIAPDGSIHRCHSDLYNLRQGIGHVLDEDFALDRTYRFCSVYGNCSGCDTKNKTNRFQQHGHTSVEINSIGTAKQERTIFK